MANIVPLIIYLLIYIFLFFFHLSLLEGRKTEAMESSREGCGGIVFALWVCFQ